MDELNILVYLVGSFFVVIFALTFFNTHPGGFEPEDKGVKEILKIEPELQPALPKYVTERTRYHIYSWIFVGLTLTMYFFVSFIFPYVVANYTGTKSIALPTTGVIVVGTLMFIGLSPKLPFIKDLLESYKQNLYKKAQIPDKGMAVFRHLMYGELDQKSERFRENLSVLLSDECTHNIKDSLNEDYFSFGKDTIERRWARLIYLVYCLENWSKEDPFKRHIDSGALCWLQIKSLCVEKILPEMVKYKTGNILTDDEKEQLRNRLYQTSIKVYWLVTLLLFMSNKGGEIPDIHLKKIGWIINPDSYFKFSMNQVVFTGTVVLFSIILGATIGGIFLYLANVNGLLAGAENIDSKELFRWVVFGIPMFVLPLLSTLAIKRFLSMHNIWEVYRPEKPKIVFSQRPWDIYLPVAVAGYLVTLAVLMAIAAFVDLPGDRTLKDAITPLAMYSLIAAMTSLYVSYLLDTPTPGWEKDYKFYLKNIFPAILQGCANVIIITFCVVYFSESKTFDLTALNDHEQSRLLVYSITAFLIGISMHMTSRIRTKHYDRREIKRVGDSSNWLTVTMGGICRRIVAKKESANSIEVIADNQLQAVADIGDEVQFSHTNENPVVGKISALNANTMTISLQA